MFGIEVVKTWLTDDDDDRMWMCLQLAGRESGCWQLIALHLPRRRATTIHLADTSQQRYQNEHKNSFQDLPYDPRNIPADLFFLGYLRETIGVRLKPLNPRYSYDDVPLHRWLQSQSGLPLPFLFAKVNEELMKSLWIKTEQIHHLQKSHGHQNIFH